MYTTEGCGQNLKKPSQVDESFQALEKSADVLSKTIADLENLLSSILIARAEKTISPEATAPNVPLALRIHSVRMKIERATDYLREIKDRCEL